MTPPLTWWFYLFPQNLLLLLLTRTDLLHVNFLAWVRAAILGSMQYAHYTPGKVEISFAETLQVFSMKLNFAHDNAGGFKLPLRVYGFVAVRDKLDSRRNMLFSCSRTGAQELTQNVRSILHTNRSSLLALD